MNHSNKINIPHFSMDCSVINVVSSFPWLEIQLHKNLFCLVICSLSYLTVSC